jgi:hypothetical protein
MPDRRRDVADALSNLIAVASDLYVAELTANSPEREDTNPEPARAHQQTLDERLDSTFAVRYQQWYSEALSAVEQLLPDRYDEFRDLYQPRQRKAIEADTYGIADYIGGLSISYLGAEVFSPHSVAMQRFQTQRAILVSAQGRLESLLINIQGVLEASLFDSELAAAAELLAGKHIRSAGIVAGVVLERHLQTVVATHKIPFKKKPTLTNLNDALKEAGVFAVPEWRKTQRLTDIRDHCAHVGDDEPTPDDVRELIDGVDSVVKSVS